MSIFTVYCHGTGFNRVKGKDSDELVAWFHNHTLGVEATLSGSRVTAGSYMINEGPGHSGNGVEQPQQINPITGNRKVNLSLKKVFTGPSFSDHLRGNTGGPKWMAGLRGKISGQGWDENVQRTVNIIQELQFGHGQSITVVNMVGWSRGAVTCMRIANAMYEVFKTEIKCNIVAVDPVAGAEAGLEMADTQVLEANVERYVGFLAMHEMRTTFKPQDWSRIRAPNTTAIFLPMPGVHNSQVMVKNPPDAAYITRNLTCGLVTAWGTQLDKKPFTHLSSAADMCIAYARLVLSLSEHKSYETTSFGGRKGGATLSLRRREFATHSKMDTYTRGGKESYWINEHHRACFAAAYPDIYEFIFESRGSGEIVLTSQSRFSAFFKAIKSDPLRQSLMSKGLLALGSDGKYTIGVGVGRYSNQMKCAWPADFPLFA
jgi:hypothetical protein